MKTLQERFDEKYEIITETGCWIWIAATHPQGYGQLKYHGQMRLAHRISYQIYNGPIKDKLCVCHKCDTPLVRGDIWKHL